MIKIHYDFTDGTEVSYIEGKQLKDNFTTNCLDFFNQDVNVDDVIVIDKIGNQLSRKLLISNNSNYTNKYIRNYHDLHKMLKSKNCLKWQIKK